MSIFSITSIFERPVVVFTGAGISYDAPTCLPLGAQLVDILLKVMLPPEIRAYLDDTSLRPEVVMQVLWEYAGESIFTSLSVLSQRPPNKIHALIEVLRAKGKIDSIVTTNLDLCHEKSSKKIGTNEVIHLHGIADNKDTIMYALDQVSNKRAQEVGNVLQNYIQHSTVIFLGYSGRDDFDIAPALRNLPSNIHFVWVDHDEKMNNWELKQDYSISDSYFVLSGRPAGTVDYIRGNTWAFLKDWASSQGADEAFNNIENELDPFSYNSISIRKEVAHSISKSILRLDDENARLVVSEFLFRFLNRAEEADQVASQIEPQNIPSNRKADYYRLLGYVKYRCGIFSEANKAFQKCLDAGGRNGLVIRCLADIAYRRNDFKLAEKLMLQAIKESELDSEKGIRDKGQILNSYGLLLQDTGRRNEAIKAYEKAEEFLRKEGDIYGVSDILNNKGTLYSDEYKLSDAEREFRESLCLRKQINHVQGICYSYLNIGIIKRKYFCMDGKLSNYEEAEKLIFMALQVLPDEGAELDRALIKKNLGDLFLDKADFIKAEKFLTQAYEIFSSLNGQEGYRFSCLLSLLELKLLCLNRKEVIRLIPSLELLSEKNQLQEKVYWYNLIKKGINDGFQSSEMEKLDAIQAVRYRQLITSSFSISED